MKRIFLSASVPLPSRNPKYLATADVIAIREAVKGLVAEAVGNATIVFGGHPAITPLIALLLRGLGDAFKERLVLYQSAIYKGRFPAEKDEFVNVIEVPAVPGSDEDNKLAMRRRMINDQTFDAGVFIGGMNGVEAEFEMFKARHKNVPIWPIASTGAAASIIFEKMGNPRPDMFRDELTYATLFRNLMREI